MPPAIISLTTVTLSLPWENFSAVMPYMPVGNGQIVI